MPLSIERGSDLLGVMGYFRRYSASTKPCINEYLLRYQGQTELTSEYGQAREEQNHFHRWEVQRKVWLRASSLFIEKKSFEYMDLLKAIFTPESQKINIFLFDILVSLQPMSQQNERGNHRSSGSLSEEE